MNVLMGSSSILHSPLHFPSTSSSSYSQSSVLVITRNAESRRRNRASIVAYARVEEGNDAVFSKRRAVMLVGISVLPFLTLRASALEGVASQESELSTTGESQKTEGIQTESPSNPFLSLLNGVGIFGTGVLGSLYALAREEKKNTDATIESINTKLREKEAVIISLEKEYESKLLKEQEDRAKQLKKAKEEQQSLTSQLSSANSTITGLGQELKKEKKLIEELKIQIENLQSNLFKAGDDKRALEEKLKVKLESIEVLQDKINLLGSELKEKDENVRNLNSTLVEKESELRNLNSSFEETKDELTKADLEIKGLRDKIGKNKRELDLKNSAMDELNARVSSLIVERDGYVKQIEDLQKDFNDLKISSQNKADSDAKILEEKEEELNQMKEKLEVARKEANENQVRITVLTEEKEELTKVLDGELTNVKNLTHELEITQETLAKTKNDASDLSKQLNQSRNLCSDLESEISRVKAEFSEAKDNLINSLEEARRENEILADEVNSANELSLKTNEELQIVSRELAAVSENRDSLQKELVEVYNRVEATANELAEEKRVLLSLHNELQALEKQIAKDKEGRKTLETDLEEATKSLDEMNPKVLELSSNLERANAQISSLEDEKEMLHNALIDQKNVTKEVQENMQDAHNLVMRLGKEREDLAKKETKLIEELASAKGEILRLRNERNSPKVVVDDENSKKVEDGNKVTVNAKKVTRRRKASSQ